MDLAEFSTPLPKPWLNIKVNSLECVDLTVQTLNATTVNATTVNATTVNANTVDANTYLTHGVPTSGFYDANVVASLGMGVTTANFATFLQLQQIAQITGSFTALMIAMSPGLSFDVDLVPGTSTVLTDRLSVIASGAYFAAGAAPSASVESWTVLTPTRIRVTLAPTTANLTFPGTNIRIVYSIMYYSGP